MCKTTADQHPHGALRVSRILPEQKTSFMRCSAYLLNTTGAKTIQVALREIPLSAEIQTLPKKLSLDATPPKSSRTPQEEPHFVALSAGATSCINGAPEWSSCGLFPPR
jgi:hypothetical protein